MSAMVLDASITMAWLLEDEKDPRAEVAQTRLTKDRAFVPQLWHLEVRNCLIVAKRRGHISADRVTECLEALKWLPIQTDTGLNLSAAFSLAQTHNLSFYDAVYLELAKRQDAALASLDAALVRAAEAEGLSLVEAV